MGLITFDAALGISEGDKRHLMLGNGFSIAWNAKVFNYESLFQKANFKDIPRAQELFDAAGTMDFEIVIRQLTEGSKLVHVYGPGHADVAVKMLKDANELKGVLVRAIAENHPDRPSDIPVEAYQSCRKFLRNFARHYTLNYDLLLYWAFMQDEIDELNLVCDDGFRSPEENEDAEYVAWEDHQSATVNYLHGALHIFDSGYELQKYTWNRTNIPLIDQIRSALAKDLFPLFVAEGTSRSKSQKINHSGYLHKALRSFESITGSLFIYGHSLASNDEHILRKIESNRSKITNLFVSIYGDEKSPDNKRIIQRAELMSQRRVGRKGLKVHFFDADTARVWG